MRIRPAIFALILASVSCYARPQQGGQQSDQQSDQQKAQSKTQGQDAKPAPAEANPFPEEESRKAAEAANGAATGTEAGTKSTAPGYSSSHVDMKRFDEPEGSESRISNGAGGFIHNPALAAQDDKVAKFYLQNGDFKGAFDRYKEATEVAPEDADAVFGLAEAARGLHRTQDAVANYTLYLDAFPDGKKSKEARKALAALSAPPKK